MRNRFLRIAGFALTLLGLASRVPAQQAPSISEERLAGHVKRLASDEFEGRGPGTRGEDLTVAYLTDQFKAMGLQPGNPNGTYIQHVPLMGFTCLNPTISYTVDGKKTDLAFPGECIVTSQRTEPRVTVQDSEIVFVGYGIVAPEYGWDDYKGVDVRGKTILMLVNDPPIPDPKNPGKLDETMFKGKAMTYYGRWTYKYEIASAKGAAAAIIVHETGPAGYPYMVLIGSNAREHFGIQTREGGGKEVPVAGWITVDKARELAKKCGQDFASLKAQAARKEFKPVALGAKASFQIENKTRAVASRNVAALLEGSDPAMKREYVVYTAHWDHIGKNDKLEGDKIFNGALDNASGTAGLLELANVFAKTQPRPKRSILFLAVTAEEQGLLGAKYYATHPMYPLEDTVANINMDGINPWGRTKDVEVIGYGNTTLEELLAKAAAGQGRVITPDSEPEKGKFYRSDHFEFAKLGVPAIYLKAGIDFPGKPAGYGREKLDDFTANDYHKVSDEFKEDWDFSGGVEDLNLLYQIGREVAQGEKYPEWKEGAEFKAIREKMLRFKAPRK